jgi:hypothetical protein
MHPRLHLPPVLRKRPLGADFPGKIRRSQLLFISHDAKRLEFVGSLTFRLYGSLRATAALTLDLQGIVDLYV